MNAKTSIESDELVQSLHQAHVTIFYLGIANVAMAVVTVLALVALFIFAGSNPPPPDPFAGTTVIEVPQEEPELLKTLDRQETAKAVAPNPKPKESDDDVDKPFQLLPKPTAEEMAAEKAKREAEAAAMEKARRLQEAFREAEEPVAKAEPPKTRTPRENPGSSNLQIPGGQKRVPAVGDNPTPRVISPPEAASFKKKLKISALGASWLRVTAIDANSPRVLFEGVVKKGETFDGAAERFEIMAGIPNQLKYSLGNEQMKLLGTGNSPISIQLPKKK